MRSINQDFIKDLENNEIEIAHLLIIKLSAIGQDDLYFTNASRPLEFYDDEYRKQTFVPLPFKVGTITINTETEFKSVTLTVSNITKEFSELVMMYKLELCDVILYEISRRMLDNPAYRVELVRGVLDKPKITEENFEISLEQAHEIKGIKLPRRQHRKRCTLVFKRAPDCPYTGTAKSCDKSKTTCDSLGMTKYFGGFLRVADSADVRGANG